MARDDPQMKLRLPEDLRTRILDAASSSGRSMNAEIVVRLLSTFEAEIAKASPDKAFSLVSAITTQITLIFMSEIRESYPENEKLFQELLTSVSEKIIVKYRNWAI